MQERRKADLEAKRQKILELKQRREARERNAGKREHSQDPPVTAALRKGDINEIINQLVGPRSPRSSAGSAGPSTPNAALLGELISAPHSGRVSRASDTGSDAPGQVPPARTSTPPIAPPVPPVERPQPIAFSQPRQPKVDRITYSREVQTVDFEEAPRGPSEEDILRRIQTEVEAAQAQREQGLEEENDRIVKEIEEQIRDLSEEERTSILTSPEFVDFVEESSKIIQRALSDAYDYTRDYRIGADAEAVEYEGKRVKMVCAFSDERWTKNRSITDLDWSPKYPELNAASYNKNPAAINDPDGIVAVWNMHLTGRPEFVFHSQSDVLSVAFSPFHPNLIFGGTYSGQILLWDTRSKHLPVLKTPLSAAGHTYPVYAMSMVGTQNAHNLMTTSTDGMVCSWLVDMLAQPQETLELVHAGHNKTNEVAITTFNFPDNETSTFWVGTEEGNVYQASRYDRAGSKAGLNQFDIYKGHNGPVTGLHFHPLSGPIDFSDLFLTSSVDWTVKLWKAKSIAKPSTVVSAVSPLYSFEEADDYVYDVQWHPNHPAMFGTVDGSGKFDLWNLNLDPEVPMVSTMVGSGRAINKLAWDRKDGRRAVLGGSDGKLYVYDIGEAGIPRETEWTDFQKTVAGILSANAQGILPGESDVPPGTPTTNGRS